MPPFFINLFNEKQQRAYFISNKKLKNKERDIK